FQVPSQCSARPLPPANQTSFLPITRIPRFTRAGRDNVGDRVSSRQRIFPAPTVVAHRGERGNDGGGLRGSRASRALARQGDEEDRGAPHRDTISPQLTLKGFAVSYAAREHRKRDDACAARSPEQ